MVPPNTHTHREIDSYTEREERVGSGERGTGTGIEDTIESGAK